MTWTGLETFDTTVKADIWLKEIMMELNTDSRRIAMALRSVLLALRTDLLSMRQPILGHSCLFLSGVSTTMNGFHQETPSRIDISMNSGPYSRTLQWGTDIKAMTKAVFKVLRHRVTEGEIKDVKGMMPDELKELWS